MNEPDTTRTDEPDIARTDDPSAPAGARAATGRDDRADERARDEPRRRARRRAWAGRVSLPWVVAALATLAAVAFAVLWLQARSDVRAFEDAAAEREALEETARAFVLDLTNFGYQTIEADVRRIRSYATGPFEHEVEEFFGPDNVRAIRAARAVSEAEIDKLFVQSLGRDAATVFAVVEETVTNETIEDPRTDIVRMEIGFVRTTSGWKVDRVELFQSPGDAP